MRGKKDAGRNNDLVLVSTTIDAALGPFGGPRCAPPPMMPDPQDEDSKE